MMRTFRFDLPACFMTRACLHILFVFTALFTLVSGQTALAQSVREDTTGLRAPPPPGEEDPPYNYAQMILQDVPREMVTGRLYDVSISMRNTGTTIWYGASGAYKLGSYAPQGNMTWGLDRVRLTTSMTGVGNTGKFDFQVRAPSIPGVYNFQWQMLQEGVEWFGAPSYPVAITVREPINNAQPAGQSVTTQMQAGERYNVSVTMVNNGETTWNWGQQYTLMSQSPHNNTTWGNNRVPLPVDNIAPGQSVTFNFPVTAPSVAGSYVMQWGMQREGYGSFGPGTTPVTINVVAPYNDAQVVSVNVPARMQARQSYNVAVTMRNSGTTTWTPGAHYNLGSQNTPLDQIWGLNRVSLASPVAPGQQYTFNFSVTAPVPEDYTMQWRMVQDGVEWFGGTTANQIKVTEDLSRVTFIHTDGLGSPVARTDGNGNLVSRTRYEPYGHVASGATPTIGFTGHVNDADTGLTYMQQRYYDPVAGRFLSIDPVVTDASTGDSFNRYAYANNSPYKYVDPDGRFGVLGAFVGAGIEIGLQLAMQGKVDNWTAVGVAGAAGMVTGGLGGVIGKAAVSGTVTTSRAVTAAAAVGGAAGATSKVAEASLTGKSTSSKEVAVAAGLGAVGGGAGAKIGLSAVAAVERLVGRSGVAGHIGTTTQGAIQQGGRIVEPATTAGQTAAQNATDISTSYVEKKVN